MPKDQWVGTREPTNPWIWENINTPQCWGMLIVSCGVRPKSKVRYKLLKQDFGMIFVTTFILSTVHNYPTISPRLCHARRKHTHTCITEYVANFNACFFLIPDHQHNIVENMAMLRASLTLRKVFGNHGVSVNTRSRSTLIARQYHFVLPIFIVGYIALQLIIGLASNVCSRNSAPMSQVSTVIHYCCGFSFFVSTAQQIGKIFEIREGTNEVGNRGIYLANMSVNVIAGSSAWLTAYYQYGGTCTSVFGVETVTAQWAEWIASVPLICYMAVAIKDTPIMSNEDIAIVVLSCVAVVCGFLENFNQMPLPLGIVIFVVGTFSMCSTLGLGLLSSWRRYRVISIDSKQRGEDFDDLIAQATKQRSLSVLLFLVYPAFPVIYILGIVKVLDRDGVFIAFQIAGVAAKLLFVSSIADAHMGLSRIIDKLRLSAEEAANTTRRTFLRYVFDQIRRPLNTVVMGCVVVGDNAAQDRWTPMSKGALDMMSAASTLISDTVEDVFALQKIEEGSMELTKSRFTVADLISGSIQIVKPFADSKLINISVSDVGKPNRGYLGDHTRLENVLVNLLLQSIKYCPVGSQIEIKLVEQDYALVPHHFTNTRVVAPTSVLPSTTKMAERKQSFSEVIPNAINAIANAVGGGDKKNHAVKKLNASNMMRVAAAHTRSDPYDDTKKRMCEVTLRVEDQGAPLLPQQDHAGLLKTRTYLQLEALQEGRGTGVGMVLAKEIILLTGGRFIAESVNTGPMPGNRFGFTIPFELAPNDGETSLHIIPITDSYKIDIGTHRPHQSILARDNGVVVAGSDPSTDSIASYLPRRVLVISDGHDDCRMLQTIFEMRGIPSDVVENGTEAVKVLSSKRDGVALEYDVIFVSYSMSSGEKTAKLIRDGGFQKLIFGLAGELSEKSMSSFLMSGVDVIITGNLLRAGQLDAIFSMIRKKGLMSSPKAKYVLEQRFKNEFVIRKIVI